MTATRRSLRALAVAAAAAPLLVLLPATARAQSPPAGPGADPAGRARDAGRAGSAAAQRQESTHDYGPHPRQELDAYWRETGGARQPAVVIAHGGYWSSGDKADWRDTARWFADRGVAAFSVNYRLNTEAAWPVPRDDLGLALAWITERAAGFAVDPGRITLLGSQGGGQLATVLGTEGAGAERVGGVVGLSAVASPRRAYDEAQTTAAPATRRRVRDMTVVLGDCTLGRLEAACVDRYADMGAPAHAGPGDAPMYLVHSAGDTVPGTHAAELRDRLAAAGVPVTAETVDGTASGGPLLDDLALRQRVLDWIKRTTAAPRPAAGRGSPPALARNRPAADPGPDSTPGPGGPAPGRAATAPTTDDDPPARTRGAPAAPREETHAYGPHARHRLDAYYTPGARRPALVVVHGGYWYEGDKSTWADSARWFAGQGYQVFAVNYRYNTHARWSAQRADLLAAVAWIRGHAADFDADPARVVMLGSSAGGQLATAAGTYGPGRETVKAVAALSPVASPYRAYNDGQRPGANDQRRKLRDTGVLLAGCHPAESDTGCWDTWRDVVVKNRAGGGDAPTYLVHSAGDFVPPAHSTDLCDRLSAAGVGCTVTVVPGTAHGGALFDVAGVRDGVLAWLRAHD